MRRPASIWPMTCWRRPSAAGTTTMPSRSGRPGSRQPLHGRFGCTPTTDTDGACGRPSRVAQPPCCWCRSGCGRIHQTMIVCRSWHRRRLPNRKPHRRRVPGQAWHIPQRPCQCLPPPCHRHLCPPPTRWQRHPLDRRSRRPSRRCLLQQALKRPFRQGNGRSSRPLQRRLSSWQRARPRSHPAYRCRLRHPIRRAARRWRLRPDHRRHKTGEGLCWRPGKWRQRRSDPVQPVHKRRRR